MTKMKLFIFLGNEIVQLKQIWKKKSKQKSRGKVYKLQGNDESIFRVIINKIIAYVLFLFSLAFRLFSICL
jgi:hypothetical protein